MAKHLHLKGAISMFVKLSKVFFWTKATFYVPALCHLTVQNGSYYEMIFIKKF